MISQNEEKGDKTRRNLLLLELFYYPFFIVVLSYSFVGAEYILSGWSLNPVAREVLFSLYVAAYVAATLYSIPRAFWVYIQIAEIDNKIRNDGKSHSNFAYNIGIGNRRARQRYLMFTKNRP